MKEAQTNQGYKTFLFNSDDIREEALGQVKPLSRDGYFSGRVKNYTEICEKKF